MRRYAHRIKIVVHVASALSVLPFCCMVAVRRYRYRGIMTYDAFDL